jgi:hypothetical protein
MSGRKAVLPPYKSLSAGDLSQATVTSETSNIEGYDNVAVQINATGTPTGTFAIEGSVDNSSWVAINLPTTPTLSGVDTQILINMNGLAFPYIRAVYTRSGGTGAADVWITGKAT